MTDLENFKRIIQVRRDLAQGDNNFQYLSYADSVLRFLATITTGATLFAVLIATRSGTYEFLFAPELKKAFAEKVTV